MNTVRRIGKRPDGTISVCRAKPENRGKGNCDHYEHIETDATDAVIARYNEEIRNKTLGATITVSKKPKPAPPPTKPTPPQTTTQPRRKPRSQRRKERRRNPQQEQIIRSSNGTVMTKEEFDKSVQKISETMPAIDYSLIREFYDRFGARSADEKLNKKYDNLTENIAAFLNSDDPVAVKTRNYLGPDVPTETFARLVAVNVGAMTLSEKLRKSTPARVILTSVMNDMTKERYIASVMFFGGRCCYCDRVFTIPSQNGGLKTDASGEHITPINAETPPPGATRYGNMALACRGCNSERKSEDLETWLMRTGRVPQEQKAKAYAKIQAFRRFALYSEFSKEQSDEISKAIRKAEIQIRKTRKPKNSPEAKSIVYQTITELKEKLM